MRFSMALPALLGVTAAHLPSTFTTPPSAGKHAGVGGFAIPVDVAPGVYIVRVDKDGAAHHDKIADLGAGVTISTKYAEQTNKQQTLLDIMGSIFAPGQEVSWKYVCPDGRVNNANKELKQLDHADLDGSVADLASKCGDEGLDVPAGHHVYATRGGKVAAFYCNFEKRENRCKRAAVEAKRKEIGRECGDEYVAGWTEWVSFFLSFFLFLAC